MKYTQKLGLRLPEESDRFSIEDINYNSEILDGSGGGSQPIGSPVGLLGGVTSSVIGQAEEENG